MNFKRLGIVLTAVNFGLLVVLLVASVRIWPTLAAQNVAPMLRGRALQIVDEHGRVRASISVLPTSAQKNGEMSRETVLQGGQPMGTLTINTFLTLDGVMGY